MNRTTSNLSTAGAGLPAVRFTPDNAQAVEIPAMMHGNGWHGQDVAGWWASEKLNGWRARWTGSELVSRHGNRFNCPAWFTPNLPSFEMDAEIHLGRGFTDTDVHKAIAAGEWGRLRLTVFDVPGFTIEHAMELMAVSFFPPHVEAVEFRKVQSAGTAKAIMREIVKLGGEGIMLRKPDSMYVPWRTNDLLKMKPS